MIANDRKDKDGNPIPLSKDEKLKNAQEMLDKNQITQEHFDAIAKNLSKPGK